MKPSDTITITLVYVKSDNYKQSHGVKLKTWKKLLTILKHSNVALVICYLPLLTHTNACSKWKVSFFSFATLQTQSIPILNQIKLCVSCFLSHTYLRAGWMEGWAPSFGFNDRKDRCKNTRLEYFRFLISISGVMQQQMSLLIYNFELQVTH